MRLVCDENFSQPIARGLARRLPSLDIVRFQDVDLGGPDDVVLQRAFDNRRVLLTHDIGSMLGYVQDRRDAGLAYAGVILVESLAPIGPAILHIESLLDGSSEDEWRDRTEWVTRGSLAAGRRRRGCFRLGGIAVVDRCELRVGGDGVGTTVEA